MTNQKDLKKAAALKYNKEKNAAPALAAKGRGPIAEKILTIARENDIPIQENRDLVAVLETLEIEQEIPLEIYAVVAEIFSYIYRTNAKQKGTPTP